MNKAVFFHSSVYFTAAYIYSFLYKSFMNSFYSIIIVIRMFCKYFFDFDQKKLSVCLSSKSHHL